MKNSKILFFAEYFLLITAALTGVVGVFYAREFYLCMETCGLEDLIFVFVYLLYICSLLLRFALVKKFGYPKNWLWAFMLIGIITSTPVKAENLCVIFGCIATAALCALPIIDICAACYVERKAKK